MAKRTDNLLKNKRPDLWEQLDFNKNEEEGIDINGLTYGSTKKVHWVCANGHQFDSIVGNRVRGAGCRFCAGQQVIPDVNSLGTVNPELASELHPTLNNVTAFEIFNKSGKKLWWVCSKGHEWKTSVSHRSSGTGCPICCNQKVLAGYNDLASKRPALVTEWDFKKNKSSPEEIVYKSTKKVHWTCSNNHSYIASPYLRVELGTGCDMCARTVRSDRRIETLIKSKNSTPLLEIVPFIPNEYIGTYPIEKVLSHSHRHLHFVCRLCGDEYLVYAQSVIRSGFPYYGCKKCSSKNTGMKNRSSSLNKDPNGMQTVLEDLKTYSISWAYNHNIVRPEHLTKSSTYRAFWECLSCGKFFCSSISNMKKNKSCPLCSMTSSSLSERTLVSSISKHFGDNVSYNFGNMFTYKKYRTIDGLFFVESTPIFVEYDGGYFHKDRFNKDLEKSTHLYTKGLVIRLRESSLELLPEHPNLFQKNVPYGDDEAMQTFVDEAVAWARERVAEMKPTS